MSVEVVEFVACKVEDGVWIRRDGGLVCCGWSDVCPRVFNVGFRCEGYNSVLEGERWATSSLV